MTSVVGGPAIHPTAVVDAAAQIGPGVRIGPFAVVGPNVVLGPGCVLHAHVVVDGDTELGAEVEVFPQAVLGMAPQDLKYDGRRTRLRIGARTVLREGVTVHPGSSTGDGLTEVGQQTLIMAYCHIAHDCRIGDRVVMANATQIAGHCIIDDGAVLGGATTVHQYCRIGTRALTGASARVQLDVAPYCVADGNPARLCGLNVVGLRRDGRSSAAIAELKSAYRALFRSDSYARALAELSRDARCEEVRTLCAFLKASRRGVTRSGHRRRR
ncbi:MAG: acyl-ACP--UDP-N-acetylglucosamine O-acyltransferase [Myxococcota bacterium]